MVDLKELLGEVKEWVREIGKIQREKINNRNLEINNLTPFNKITRKVRGIRRAGSAAYDLCSVAAGRFDGHWEFKLNPWDVAAGKLLIREAGGKVIDTMVKDDVSLIISGNEIICNKLVRILEDLNFDC